MEFGSLEFIFLFLPIFLLVYFASPLKIKKYTFLFFSLFFYYWISGNNLFVLIISIVINHLAGLYIGNSRNPGAARSVLIAGISFNVMVLISFKYIGFFLSGLYSVLSLGIPDNIGIPGASFPAGISFYTFVAISYLVDIYRKRGPAFRNPFDTALSFSMFPKLLSGPITLHSEFSSRFSPGRRYIFNVDEGVKRVVIGLGKKVLLADYLSRTADSIFSIPNGELTAGLAWLGAVTYSFTIYLDFSGYSDIAIGLGKILGYEIPENFNFPYISKSIREFWKRWHITLSEWLQTYLFLPTAYAVMRRIKKNRFIGIRTDSFAYVSASFITMVICGLWHGAAWTFVIWGAFHGTMLVIEHLFMRKFLKKKRFFYIQWIYAQLFIVVGWVIFRAESLSQIKVFLLSMAGFGAGTGEKYYLSLYLDFELIFILIIGIAVSFPMLKGVKVFLAGKLRISSGLMVTAESFLLILIFLFSVMAIAAGTYSPFIYFRF